MRRHVPFVAIALCGVLLASLPALRWTDLKLLDAQFRLLRAWHPQPAAREVVVVGVDEETVKRLPEPVTLWHRHLGRFLAAMGAARPAAVGVDIVLPDRSYDAVVPGSDHWLLAGLLQARRAFPLVLALTADPSGRPRPIHPPFLAVAGPGAAGYALFPVDADGRVRRYDERLGANGEPVPTFAGQLARALAVEPRGAGYLDFWRGARLDYVPFHRVLDWLDAGDRAALEQAFRGRPVLLGMVLPFTDRQAVPVSLAAWEPEALEVPGVLLHAQALRNLLDRGFIQAAPSALVAAAGAGAALLWFVSAGTLAVATLYCAVALALFAAATWGLALGWMFPVGPPLLAAGLALGSRNALDTIEKLRERRRLRASFSGYVSPAVMEEILAGRIRPELGGVSGYVCVMFSDIRGYTTRSERMTPQQVIAFLNRYFERVVALIHGRGGAVVSFMGDGIMAVFGAPKPLANPCREAFEAARAILEYVNEVNAQFRAEGEAPMEIGVGLHAGEAVIGHVGSSVRHDFTAIGDVTNVASRLEGLTKETGCRIVVSRAVAERLDEAAALVPLGPMAIKGHSPVEVYGYGRA